MMDGFPGLQFGSTNFISIKVALSLILILAAMSVVWVMVQGIRMLEAIYEGLT